MLGRQSARRGLLVALLLPALLLLITLSALFRWLFFLHHRLLLLLPPLPPLLPCWLGRRCLLPPRLVASGCKLLRSLCFHLCQPLLLLSFSLCPSSCRLLLLLLEFCLLLRLNYLCRCPSLPFGRRHGGQHSGHSSRGDGRGQPSGRQGILLLVRLQQLEGILPGQPTIQLHLVHHCNNKDPAQKGGRDKAQGGTEAVSLAYTIV